MSKALCPDRYCDNPYCRREHIVPICALCNQEMPEEDAVNTKAGLAHEECAEHVYPLAVNPFVWEGGK